METPWNLIPSPSWPACGRQQTQLIRTIRYTKSRLDNYSGQLLQLHQDGASTAELQRWLLGHRIRVAHSTVARWLAKNAPKTTS